MGVTTHWMWQGGMKASRRKVESSWCSTSMKSSCVLLLAVYLMPGGKYYVDLQTRKCMLWLHQYWEWEWIYDQECLLVRHVVLSTIPLETRSEAACCLTET